MESKWPLCLKLQNIVFFYIQTFAASRVFLTHCPEELLIVLLSVNLPCSIEVHVFKKVWDLLHQSGLEAEAAV